MRGLGQVKIFTNTSTNYLCLSEVGTHEATTLHVILAPTNVHT